MNNQFSKIHPDLQQIAHKSPKFLFSHKNLWLIKWVLNLTPAPKTPEDIVVENIFVTGQDDRTKIRLRIYKPKSSSTPTPVLIWLHGGGYVMGKPETDDLRCVQYVRELGIPIVSVDYRYAPKHPFPIGLEDSYSALKWVEAHSQQLCIGGSSSAYRDLVKRYRPDLSGAEEGDAFREVVDAYRILSDDALRRRYDAELRRKEGFPKEVVIRRASDEPLTRDPVPLASGAGRRFAPPSTRCSSAW